MGTAIHVIREVAVQGYFVEKQPRVTISFKSHASRADVVHGARGRARVIPV